MTKKLLFRFDKPRKYQKELMSDISKGIQNGKHVLCHAPVGLGKTDASLSAAISYAVDESKTVFFLTPKISQHDIAVDVVKGLVDKYELNIKAVDLVGRKYMCVNHLINNSDFDGFYEVCKKLRTSETCPYYNNYPGNSKPEMQKSLYYFDKFKSGYGAVMKHHDLIDVCENFKGAEGERPMCPYEVSMDIAKDCNVIIGDYLHLFSLGVKDKILKRTRKKLDNSIIIVDEAHNLPERVRGLMSNSLSTFSLRKGAEELKKMGVDDLQRNLSKIEKMIKGIAKLSLSDRNREALVPKEKFSKPLKDEIDDIEQFSETLTEYGINYMDATNKSKSQLFRIAKFLASWNIDLESHIRMIKVWPNGSDFSLVYKSLDPSLWTSKIFGEVHASVLMSGTLLPLKMYSDVLGLPEARTVFKEYPSPFPIENRLNLIVPTVTTKYSERNIQEFEKIAGEVAKIVNIIPGNSAVFFPSFGILEQVAPFLEEKVGRQMLRQKERMTSTERTTLLQQFKNAGNAFGSVLLGVLGGSYSEGIDLPGNQLLGVVIVGIPLQEMNLETKCLIDHYEEKYGRGWHYGYLYPAINRSMQAAGRVIRSDKDEGVVAFLDKRYTWQNYKNCFPRSFNAMKTDTPEKYIKTFWENESK